MEVGIINVSDSRKSYYSFNTNTMENPFTIKTFNNEEDYFYFLVLLKENRINFETEVLNSMIDPVTMIPIDKIFKINIESKDISKVEEILKMQALKAIENVDKTHYLFDFSTEELYEILENQDEWSTFDYQLAKKILTDRGESIDEYYLNSIELERMEKQYKTEKTTSSLIITGFALSFLGGFLGIVIGFYILTSKKILPNGATILSFSIQDRKNATWMIVISVIILLLMWYLKITNFTN